MDTTNMSEGINRDRRRFFGVAAVTIAAAQLSLSGAADAESGTKKPDLPRVKPGTHTTFGTLKQINAGVLNVGYAEAGPGDGPAVILLHGWPYDIHSYAEVAPLLAKVGYRVIVPYLRGYGSTRFLSSEMFRNGQPAALALDSIALGDANGAAHPDATAYAKKFSGKYTHRLITGGIGHNLPQEAPQAFAQAIVDVDAM